MNDITENLKSEEYPLFLDNTDKYELHKVYLLPTNEVIEGTNKVYYDGYLWRENGSGLDLVFSNTNGNGGVQLNTNNQNEVHFLLDNGSNGLFEINFDDGHLYYQIELIDDEL